MKIKNTTLGTLMLTTSIVFPNTNLRAETQATNNPVPMCMCQCPYAKKVDNPPAAACDPQPAPASDPQPIPVCEPEPVSKCQSNRGFFVKIMSGASFTRNSRISAPSSFWDPAPEGYNSRLGTGPIIGGGVGYQFSEWFSADITVAHRWSYKYNKFQSGVPNPGTPAALSDKTRHFSLQSTSFMFTPRINGKGMEKLHYKFCNGGILAPFAGVGIGFALNRMNNFRTTIAPNSNTGGFNGAASIGSSSVTKTSLAYQFETGLEYLCNKWGFSVGYRWFDAGKFRGPNNVIAGTAQPGNPIVGVSVPPWRGRLRAHEVFAEITYYFH